MYFLSSLVGIFPNPILYMRKISERLDKVSKTHSEDKSWHVDPDQNDSKAQTSLYHTRLLWITIIIPSFEREIWSGEKKSKKD